MKVIEPGHVYELDQIDKTEETKPQVITFVNRDGTGGHTHAGTQTQEILRVVIDMMNVVVDRTNHCDNCIRWEGNDRIIKAMTEIQRQARLALLIHEERALERKMERGDLKPEQVVVDGAGHLQILGMQDHWRDVLG